VEFSVAFFNADDICGYSAFNSFKFFFDSSANKKLETIIKTINIAYDIV